MWPWKKDLDPNNDNTSVIDNDAFKINEYEQFQLFLIRD